MAMSSLQQHGRDQFSQVPFDMQESTQRAVEVLRVLNIQRRLGAISAQSRYASHACSNFRADGLREPPQLSGRGPPAPNAGMQPVETDEKVRYGLVSSLKTSHCLPSTSRIGGGNDEFIYRPSFKDAPILASSASPAFRRASFDVIVCDLPNQVFRVVI
ncbi:hypothetical protein B0T18DRAFT_394599 [Schizothecium vesticola]|uniref:Uncharacterized protein n=1 Tax=Schizothecium vesticola TaxID=314040 RepID=A0AA40BQ08_9PEZI|nr:hypothetical protein B0T18DRAFT_394599 [Schizothecium vesticola]